MRSVSAVDYLPVVNRFLGHTACQKVAALQARECISRVESVTNLDSGKRKNADRVAESVLETLDLLGVVRTPGQKQFHLAFFNACLPHIYGSDEFESDRERILHRFGFTHVRYEVLVVCPRRWGKTYGVSMFMAALLWCVPDMWISIFSTGQRASTALLDLIYKWIAHLCDGDKTRIGNRNKEVLFIKGESINDTRRCYSYPSSLNVRARHTPSPRCACAARRSPRRAARWYQVCSPPPFRIRLYVYFCCLHRGIGALKLA
jgi:hypothetical protein